MTVAALIYERRTALGYSQDDLARALNGVLSEPTMTQGSVCRWELGKQVPTAPRLLAALSEVLRVPLDVLRAEARLSKLDRRSFLSLAALTALYGSVAAELYASLAGGDPGPLTTVQTNHGTDLVLASMVEPAARSLLTRWAEDGSSPVLRVNAAGILAKTSPAQDAGPIVARVLTHDAEVSARYVTAVVARVFSLDWSAAQLVAADPTRVRNPQSVARRLSAETLNSRDAGARWCAATLLRSLSPLTGV